MMGTPITKQTGVSIGLVIAIIGLTVWLTTQLAGKADTSKLEELSGQLGNLSSSNARSLAEMQSLRRDLDRVEAALLRVEEKLP